MWDEDTQQEFDLRALLFVTINDWPALSNLSGQTNKGYKACTHCLDETESIYLPNCNKNVYMGHRRFLSTKHALRKKGKDFKGEADRRKNPDLRTGDDILDMVKDLPEQVICGKGPGGKSVPNDADGHAPMRHLQKPFKKEAAGNRPISKVGTGYQGTGSNVETTSGAVRVT